MTDEAIILRIRAGEQEMFATLVERYSERVLALIARFVDDEAEVQDAAQETFISAFGALERFRGEASFASWLYRIAYNHALQRLRRRRLRTLSLDDDGLDDIADEAADAFFASERDDRLSLLVQALQTLPPVDRTIIELFYYEDLSLRDIALALDMTETAVSTKLYRLRKRLYKSTIKLQRQ